MDFNCIFTIRTGYSEDYFGELAKQVDFLWWLSYGQEFGLTSPILLDLNVITLTFGMTFKINIASIIGMVVAIFIYRKI